MTITVGARERSANDTTPEARDWSGEEAVVLPALESGSHRTETSSFSSAAPATSPDRGLRIHQPVVRPREQPIKRQFQALARWEGAVTELFATYFVAEVVDLDSGERAVAEFEMKELAEFDRALCKPGGLFYWSIGYDIKESGQRYRASTIRFRRLGKGLR